MADVWDNTKTNWLRDLAVRKARTGKLTHGKIVSHKGAFGKLTFGKAS